MLKLIKCLTFITFASIFSANAHYFSESHSKWVVNGVNIEGTFNIFELDAASNNSVDDIRKLNDQMYKHIVNKLYKEIKGILVHSRDPHVLATQ